MSPSDKAVRKASRERLLRDMRRAAWLVKWRLYYGEQAAELVLTAAQTATSRTRYACLMTAFGG